MYLDFSKIFLFWFVWGFCFLKILFIVDRGREGEKEGNINVWLPLVRPLLGTWPATQACALTGNRTSDTLLCGDQHLLGRWSYRSSARTSVSAGDHRGSRERTPRAWGPQGREFSTSQVRPIFKGGPQAET